MVDIYTFLAEKNISFHRFDHPPVYTVEDVHRLTPDLPGAKTKNLFLKENKGKRHFLVVTSDHGRVDLKALPQVLGSHPVSFGSPDRLMKCLGVEPGAVSLLALLCDTEKAVEVIIDSTLWRFDEFQFHPLVNTSTLILSKTDVERFLEATGHRPKILNIPYPQDKS
ncbi:MAG: prolyl-tRNA synthetase associated domain-containing protein [Thermodesulfobacteriota bacterium]